MRDRRTGSVADTVAGRGGGAGDDWDDGATMGPRAFDRLAGANAKLRPRIKTNAAMTPNAMQTCGVERAVALLRRLSQRSRSATRAQGAGVSALGIDVEAFLADPIKLGGDRAVDPARRRRGSGIARLREPVGGLGREVDRPSPAEQLEEDHAEAVDVAPLVGLVAPAAGLLGAHVGRGADDRPVACQVRVEVGPPRQSEVGQVGTAMVVDDDVVRLQVAMEDLLPVRVVERVGQVADHADDGGHVHPVVARAAIRRGPRRTGRRSSNGRRHSRHRRPSRCSGDPAGPRRVPRGRTAVRPDHPGWPA